MQLSVRGSCVAHRYMLRPPLNIASTQLYDADCADTWESLVVLETVWFVRHSASKLWLLSALLSKQATSTTISGMLHTVVADTLRAGFTPSALFLALPLFFGLSMGRPRRVSPHLPKIISSDLNGRDKLKSVWSRPSYLPPNSDTMNRYSGASFTLMFTRRHG